MSTEAELASCVEERVRKHGFDAHAHAASRAAECLERADWEGVDHWREVLKRILLLTRRRGTLD